MMLGPHPMLMSKMVSSAPALTWTKRTSAWADNLRAVTYGPSGFIAVGDFGKIQKSADGITWSNVTSPVNKRLLSAHYANGLYVVGSGTPASGILRSVDGTTWLSSTPSPSSAVRGITYTGSVWIAVGEESVSLYRAGIHTSPDAITWTKRVSAIPSVCTSIIHASGLSVIVGNGGGIQRSSDDGVTWIESPSGTVLNLAAIAYGNGVFVATGLPGSIFTSPDAISWTARTGATSEAIRGLAFVDGSFIGVGENNTVQTSPDGITWTSQVGAIPGQSNTGIAAGASVLVAVGTSGSIQTASI